jgi:hypothetical protein
MLKISFLIIYFLFIVIHNPINAQLNNLKSLKSKVSKEVKKVVEKEIKPLTLDHNVKKIRYNPIKSINKVGLDIVFNGNNPNKIGVSLNRVEFDLYIDGKHATKFYNDKKIVIPKNGDFSFEEKADLKLSTLGKVIFNSIVKKKAKYRVDGTYFIETSIGTFPLKAKLAEKEM